MNLHDQLHRYLFTHLDIRGELVTISDTWQQILINHNYPPPVQNLLGEMLVATSLLTATLKFSGAITVQLQGDGPLSLLVINGDHQQQMRGVARWKEGIPAQGNLKTLLGNGVMVITITPEKGERYQGVVALAGDSLAACLEDYFLRSEQLATRLFFYTGKDKGKPVAAGLLLQALPARQDSCDDISHLAILTQTLTSDEICGLPAQEILRRLYHEENITLYPPQSVTFKCTCSQERCASVLQNLPAQEISGILTEKGKLDIHCDYCGRHYCFDTRQVAEIRNRTP